MKALGTGGETIETNILGTDRIVHVPSERAYSKGFEDLRRLIGFSPAVDLNATLDKVIHYDRGRAGARDGKTTAAGERA